MIRKIAVTISAKPNILQELYDGVKEDIFPLASKECVYSGEGSLKLVLDKESPSYNLVLQTCRDNNLHPYIAQWVHHTAKELAEVNYYQLSIPTPLHLEGTTASIYGTEYTGGCPYCGLGQKSIGDVLVDRKVLKKYRIGSLYPEIFISQELKTLLEEQEFTGISFSGRVVDYKGRESPDYFVMDINNILPPMSPTSWLMPTDTPTERYSKCGHQVVYLRSDIQYEKQKLIGVCDFNLTYEYLDNYRMRKIVVSSKVRDCFKSNKIRAGYFPITLL